MRIYDTSSKGALLSDLGLALVDIYEPEMREVFGSVIRKLKAISDDDFASIDSFMANESVEE